MGEFKESPDHLIELEDSRKAYELKPTLANLARHLSAFNTSFDSTKGDIAKTAEVVHKILPEIQPWDKSGKKFADSLTSSYGAVLAIARDIPQTKDPEPLIHKSVKKLADLAAHLYVYPRVFEKQPPIEKIEYHVFDPIRKKMEEAAMALLVQKKTKTIDNTPKAPDKPIGYDSKSVLKVNDELDKLSKQAFGTNFDTVFLRSAPFSLVASGSTGPRVENKGGHIGQGIINRFNRVYNNPESDQNDIAAGLLVGMAIMDDKEASGFKAALAKTLGIEIGSFNKILVKLRERIKSDKAKGFQKVNFDEARLPLAILASMAKNDSKFLATFSSLLNNGEKPTETDDPRLKAMNILNETALNQNARKELGFDK